MLKITDVMDVLAGYGFTELDEVLLVHSLNFAKSKILNEIAHDVVPLELYDFWKRLTVSDYIVTLQGLNRLEGATLSEKAVKAITEGDTRVEFSDSLTATDRMDIFIKHLITDLDYKELYSFRKMRW